MLFLTAVLVISLASLIILFGSKHIEERVGRPIFLPTQVLERDAEIEKKSRAVLRGLIVFAERTLRSGWKLSYRGFRYVSARVKEGRKRPKPKPIEKNGGGSVYLKQMMEHKNNVRNGNGNH